ncbi:MAG: flippase-like domain-containing protein, partial [Bacteroidia bacterium]|nr:flippase-like domain-containing protein [Bacteroidia bacterium]
MFIPENQKRSSVIFTLMLHFNIRNYFPRWLLWSVKALIAVVAIRFILQKVFTNESLDELTLALQSLSGGSNTLIVLLVLVLIPINLFIETWKWKLAMLPLEKISFINCFAAVLTGIAVSFFTPNRAGEFAGRILYVNHSDKIKASLITILAGMSQLVITISVGSICLLFYLRKLIS